MSITNTSKPTSSVTNTTKVAVGETWATDLNTWNAESRTWDATISIISNIAKTSSSMTNIARP